MRVIAGSAKSIPLKYPSKARIRPTTDAMREALFASIAGRVVEARFADLYAGCGSVGIEALSRGAASCVFVEQDPRCVQVLRANLQAARLTQGATVTRGFVERIWARIAQESPGFGIVFADPPYGLASFAEVARRLVVDREGVASGGLVVLQYGASWEQLGLPEPSRIKKHGETVMLMYEMD
ncbi:MAG: 16S rRNA (guanine(966)-N(2))-methyltransferase RsmD [Armatimonadetes bacterium]|nr:16S rRNA (guanine(966)-N(2))-methyltransferase RsmD [Armatimonadota bacterium]